MTYEELTIVAKPLAVKWRELDNRLCNEEHLTSEEFTKAEDEQEGIIQQIEELCCLFFSSDDENLNETFRKIPKHWTYDDHWTGGEDCPDKEGFVFSWIMGELFSEN